MKKSLTRYIRYAAKPKTVKGIVAMYEPTIVSSNSNTIPRMSEATAATAANISRVKLICLVAALLPTAITTAYITVRIR